MRRRATAPTVPVDVSGTAEEATERLKGDVDKLLIEARKLYAELETGR